MNIFGKLLIKSEIVSNIKGDTDKRLAGLKTNDITLTDVQEYDESNVVFAKFKINGDDGAEFGMTLRSKKNRLVNYLYALSAIRMADEFVEHDCWAAMNKMDDLAHHYLESVKLPSYPTLLSRKEWMDRKVMEGVFAYRKINCSGFGVTEEYYIEPHGEMRKVHATEFDANQDLHRIVGRKTYNLYGIVDGEPKLLGTWYGVNSSSMCWELSKHQPLEYPILDRMPSHFEYNDHPLFFDMENAKDYADSLKKRRHEVWGVKPISKSPVLLGVYEATSFVMAAGLCPHATKHGFFNDLWYNGNPVFPSKYDAAQHIVERYGVKTEYAVYGYNPIMKCADYIGDGVGKTFDEATNRLFTKLNHQQPHISTQRLDLDLVRKWRYYGHPLFHTKEQAETYGKRQEALDSIIKSISAINTENVKRRMVAIPNTLKSDGMKRLLEKAKPQVSMGYRIGVDMGAPEGDKTVHGNATLFGDMSGFDVMPVQHLGFPNTITFVRTKKKQHKVQDLPYFSEVAQAIGTTDAAMELYKVLKCIKCHDDIMNEELDMAFTWHLSPQGDSFWAEVEARIQDQRTAEEQEILDESEDEGCKPQ